MKKKMKSKGYRSGGKVKKMSKGGAAGGKKVMRMSKGGSLTLKHGFVVNILITMRRITANFFMLWLLV